MLGQLIQGSGLAIDAVEPNPDWAAVARPYYRNSYTGTIESVSLPEKHYQVIVCGDVLEHTVDPAEVLRQLRRLATDDAVFIVSVPNVAHFSVRLMLLFGLFPKMPRGILDRTHLHFFTRKTAIAMLNDAGLTVSRILKTGVPLEQLGRGDGARRTLAGLSRLQNPFLLLMPRLFAFQWIFVASAGSRPVSPARETLVAAAH
jgi:SAM-dependent methyltransferase